MNQMTTKKNAGRDMVRKVKAEQMSFVTEDQLAVIAEDDETRMTPILVRCGNGRFTCPAQNAAWFIKIINAEGTDYVRDASIYSSY